jgi:UDP-galactopyranose mutase
MIEKVSTCQGEIVPETEVQITDSTEMIPQMCHEDGRKVSAAEKAAGVDTHASKAFPERVLVVKVAEKNGDHVERKYSLTDEQWQMKPDELRALAAQRVATELGVTVKK